MFRITFVCAGNRCRSPYAERALQRLAPNWVQVDSAGILDLGGEPSPRALVAVAGARNIDLTGHRSRVIGDARLEQTDLVLCMSREHVATAVVDGGARKETAFTISEFLRYLEPVGGKDAGGGADHVRAIVAEIHNRRSRAKTFVPLEEIDDPLGGPTRAYEAMAARLDEMCSELARGLGWTTADADPGAAS